MKAKDLIALLGTISPDAEVVTRGSDGYGFANAFCIEPVKVRFNVWKRSHAFPPHGEWHEGEPGAVDAYCLNGDW